MVTSLQAAVAHASAATAPLQALPGGAGFVATPLGKLLVALVVIALVLFIGRFVLKMAWRLVKIAIVLVALFWLVSVVLPQFGVSLGL